MNLRRLARVALRGALVTVFAAIAVAAVASAIAVAVGYRPVVIMTGSMGVTAPPGALAVAAPTADLAVGDILVMRTDGRATITHRIVDLDRDVDGRPVAVTRGDANPDIDPTPYVLGERELTVRHVVPRAGRALTAVRTPAIGLPLVGALVLGAVIWALRRIWGVGRPTPASRNAPPPPTAGPASTPPPPPPHVRANRARGRIAPAVAAATGAAVAVGGIALSLYAGVAVVAGNDFTTLECYDARLDQVQSGDLTTDANGATTVAIAEVDPARSFLLFSASSASGQADDSMVLGRLVSATEVEFVRASDGTPPGPVSVAWSLVEYACGVSVQRGTASGTGSAQLDTAIQPVDPAASFVTVSSLPNAGATSFSADHAVGIELVDADTVRLSSGGSIAAGTEHAWQVVTFDDDADLATQVVTASLPAGTAMMTIPVPTPVDTASTFVLASVTTPNSGGDVGDRMVRVRLVDGATVEVTRQDTAGSVDVSVQVVELRDGTTVQHGVLDLAVGQDTATATIPPVTVTRSSAFSTVQLPAGHSGGSTTSAAGAAGEASVRVGLLDAATVEVHRDSTVAPASFAWQVVTWGGPGWADLSSPFRRRIDVTAGSVVTPNGYTTSLTFDHASMVADDLSSADGDDLRIWRHDGTTWTELDRVLDQDSSWGAAQTTVWFRTQEPIAADATVSYWLYFGNDAPAAPLADPANVWLVSEGFDDGTTGAFEDRTGGTGWYRALPWTRRIVLSIDPADVPATLTDEPVLVRVVDPDLTAHALPDGSDLRFTAADGVTPLAHDIEAFDHATGTLTAWVRVPSVDATTTTELHLYYGAPDAPLQADPRTTWADDLAVWQLAADPAGPAPTLDDSGPGGHDGAALADAASTATSSGPGVAVDGALDRLESAPMLLDREALAVSVLFEADSLAADSVLVAQGDPTAGGSVELAIDTAVSPTLRARLRIDGTLVEVSGGTVGTGAPHHAAVTWDGDRLRLYLDGIAVGDVAAAGGLDATAAVPVVIGADPAGANAFAGVLADVRIDDSAWAAARVAFRAANLLTPTSTVSAAAPTAGTWFDQGDWVSRRPLVIDSAKVAGDLVDFPVFVQLAEPDLAASAQADGDDLVFTAADGVTRLDHHIESWNPATGELAAWVRVPSLDDSTNTKLYLYSDNPAAVDQQDPDGVWGPDADLVVIG